MAALVLRRKLHEAIIVGECRVEVIEINGKNVALSVHAPPYITVDREEVFARKCAERRALEQKGAAP